MNNIVPIIVQRQRFDGTQQIINYPFLGNIQLQRDYLEKFRIKKNKYHHTLQPKKQNVRIRRVQSSGTRRKLPKDFFSKQPNKVSQQKHNYNSNRDRVSRTAQSVCKKRKRQQLCFQTPKFKDKIFQIQRNHEDVQRDRILNIPLNLKEKNSESQNKNIIFMQNTFAANSFNIIKESINNGFKRIQKQNIPKKKVKTPRQIHSKKFSLIKQKTRYFGVKNIFQ